MSLYIIRRLLLMVPTLLGVLAVVFFVMAASPGGLGGAQLSAEGTQDQNLDARRIQKQQQRRYGFNLSAPEQFGRWLNQVSPIGFRMSSEITFGEAQEAEVAELLSDLPLTERSRGLDRAVQLAEEIAAYEDRTPQEAAQQVRELLRSPGEAMAGFDRFDAELEDSERERLQREIDRLWERSEVLGQNKAVQEILFEAKGSSRIRFDRPAFKQPNLGETLTGRSVVAALTDAVPVTLLLNLLTIPLIYSISIATGVYAAKHRGRLFDNLSGALLVFLWSLPVIWVGAIGLVYFASAENLRWFPTSGLHDIQADQMKFLPSFGEDGFARGYLLDTLWHLVLPVICLTYGGFAVSSKVMRGAMLDNLSADYVRTARAKGVAPSTVLWAHVFRNSILPLITMAAGVLPALLAGSVIVERIFSINGMGNLAVEAAFAKDRDLLMATTLIGGVLSLLSELIRDICYAIADPRVSYD